MGQQQLLLLAMGLLIVALAFLAGLEAWTQIQRRSAADRIVDRNLAIASAAVYWKTKNDPFSGGNASYASLADDGMERLSMEAETAAGRFGITEATNGTLEITGVSTDFPDIGATTRIVEYDVVATDVRYDGSITLDE